MEIQLRKFDISKIRDDSVVILIGKRDTGKSFLCKDILFYHKDIPVGLVISGTEASNQFYGSIVPKLFMRSVFMNGRHYKLLFLLTMQYALGIPPALRTNADFVFILRENYVSNRKRLYDHYAGMFPTFEMFCQVMDQCTENYECLVIHNNAKSNRLDEQVFWYRADTHNDFKIGAPTFWEYSEKNYSSDNNEQVFGGGRSRERYVVDKLY